MNNFNQLKNSLTPEDIDQITKIVSCRSGKEIHLKHYLTKEELRKKIPNKPILDRLWKNDTLGGNENRWRFFAIIDARSELKMVRNIILGVYL